MCLLKDIQIPCQDFTIEKSDNPLYEKCSNKFGKEHLCTNHQLLYKNWCEDGGYFILLKNNIDATEIENIEYFKNVLLKENEENLVLKTL